ncbi:hypothetical protein [Proteiniphilum sp.]|uniref:hypothetical protein n=1 Tax=Proteiniphilum sp. TaxID=1926877 RepID=UPI002B1EDDF6|nr:hypothetical protein [Proteiniphilum sp.]MEA4916386.1 hypothetical protein [Proteiniphilum sp.]
MSETYSSYIRHRMMAKYTKPEVDNMENLSVAIEFPTFEPGRWRWIRYAASGLFDNDKKLKDYTEEEWNTLLYVDGNLDIILRADYIIDMGPGTGSKGGKIAAQGTPEQIKKSKHSITGKYLARYYGAEEK